MYLCQNNGISFADIIRHSYVLKWNNAKLANYAISLNDYFYS